MPPRKFGYKLYFKKRARRVRNVVVQFGVRRNMDDIHNNFAPVDAGMINNKTLCLYICVQTNASIASHQQLFITNYCTK